MIVGYSLSPGGLLFPYHIGALASLSHHSYLTDSNPIAGSSAGAIAVISHAANVKPYHAIEATIRISDTCSTLGGARGNLLPLLQMELEKLLEDDVQDVLNAREGFVGVAYRELFPRYQPVLDTFFESKDHVIDSVCNSSMFPFFATNWPCRRVAYNNNNRNKKEKDYYSLLNLPRIAVDGFFTVPRDRFGCPDFNLICDIQQQQRLDFRQGRNNKPNVNSNHPDDEGSTTPATTPTTTTTNPLFDDTTTPTTTPNPKVDRTITLSVFPHDVISLTASEQHDQISPLIENNDDTTKQTTDQMLKLLKLATECATDSKKDYYQLYENGWMDAERWIAEEERRGYWGLTREERRDIYADEVLGGGGFKLN